jgi:hypothetical protein
MAAAGGAMSGIQNAMGGPPSPMPGQAQPPKDPIAEKMQQYEQRIAQLERMLMGNQGQPNPQQAREDIMRSSGNVNPYGGESNFRNSGSVPQMGKPPTPPTNALAQARTNQFSSAQDASAARAMTGDTRMNPSSQNVYRAFTGGG